MSNQKIEYARYKKSKSSNGNLIHVEGKGWHNRYITKTYGFDSLLGHWQELKNLETSELVSVTKDGLTKKLIHKQIVCRTGIDSETLKPMEKYFEMTIEYKVKDPDSSIFLKGGADGRIYLTNLNLTFMISQNRVDNHVTRKVLSERPLKPEEVKALKQQNQHKNQSRHRQVMNQLQNGELQISVKSS